MRGQRPSSWARWAASLVTPESRDDSGWSEHVLEVGSTDADDAGADLDGAEVAVGGRVSHAPT